MPAVSYMFNEFVPKTLYKYRPLDESGNTLRLLSEGQAFFSRADTFNDPFDSAITYTFDNLHTQIAEEWARQSVERHMSDLPERERLAAAAQRLAELRSSPVERERSRGESIAASYKTFGIYSLSAKRDDILMWSHYADQHRGVCVGLDVSHIWQTAIRLASLNEYLDLVRVVYAREMPRIDLFEAMLADSSDEVIEFLRTKYITWAYEDEYRLIFKDHAAAPFNFGPALVCEVYMGCRMSDENRGRVLEFCREQIPHAAVFLMEPKHESFSLVPVSIQK